MCLGVRLSPVPRWWECDCLLSFGSGAGMCQIQRWGQSPACWRAPPCSVRPVGLVPGLIAHAGLTSGDTGGPKMASLHVPLPICSFLIKRTRCDSCWHLNSGSEYPTSPWKLSKTINHILLWESQGTSPPWYYKVNLSPCLCWFALLPNATPCDPQGMWCPLP